MRSPGTRGALSTLFLFYLLAFAGFLVWAVLSRPDLFPVFTWPWIWTAAFVHFTDYAVPLTVAGLAVAYSLFLRPEPGVRRPFHRLVGSQLTLLVTLTVLYTVVLFGFYPRSRTLLVELEELTRHGRTLLEQGRKEREAGKLEAARDYYERYLVINRRDQGASGELDQLNEAIDTPRRTAAGGAPSGQPYQGRTPAEHLAAARRHFGQEDWYSAVFYADLAVKAGGERPDAVTQEARRLSARAREMIRSRAPDKKNREQRDLFERKQAGYRLYQNEDYLRAYYHFLDLSRRHPEDPDVQRYLSGSREQVAGLHYFRDEAERMDPLPGPQGLLFLNRQSEGTREFVSVAKMVSVGGETWFKDLELLRLEAGRRTLHLRAPYGKLEQSGGSPDEQGRPSGPGAVILLHGVDRERPGRDLPPTAIAGKLPSREPRYVLELVPRREELAALRAPGPAGAGRLQGVGLDTLWLARAGTAAYGQLEPVLSMEILMRLLLPFALLNLGLLAMVLGWSYRLATAGRPPAPAYLVILLFPLAAALLTGVYLKVHRTLAAYALLAWGFRAALVGLAVLEGIILAVMLILLAGRGND